MIVISELYENYLDLTVFYCGIFMIYESVHGGFDI